MFNNKIFKNLYTKPKIFVIIFTMKLKFKKRCPRCGNKVSAELALCPDCSLNFQKFDEATNKEAKLAIKLKENHRVLLRQGCPSDVKKWKLILIAIFLGFMGAHHYYVGRYKMGLFYSIFFVVGVVNAVVTTILKVMPTGDLWQIFTLLVLVWGAVLVMWIIDIAKILLNKYKIPVGRE